MTSTEDREPSVTGQARPALAAIDAWVRSLMREFQIPGAALALTCEGQIVYSRGFGQADRETGTLVQPESIFRMASVSKSLTAVAVMRLVEDERLQLDDHVLDFIDDGLLPTDTARMDDRWRRITVAHCLTHTGGWDRDSSYDPMLGNDMRIAQDLGVPLPLTPQLIVRHQLRQPLDFDPGSRYAYSNFGFCVLGRVIEAVSGQPYEAFVTEVIVKPLGLERTRIAGTLLNERIAGEVRYYAANDQMATAVVGPGAGRILVPVSYGGWQNRTIDAHGGWATSATDLARFGAAMDEIPGRGLTRGGVLSLETARLMLAPHALISAQSDESPTQSYGFGWMLSQEADGIVARHTGALPSTAAILLHFPNRVNVAFLANIGQAPDGSYIGRRLDRPLTQLVQSLPADVLREP